MADATGRIVDRIAGDVHRAPDGTLTIDGREFPWPTNGVSVEAGDRDHVGHLVVRIPFTGDAVVEPLLKWQRDRVAVPCSEFASAGTDLVSASTRCDHCGQPAREHGRHATLQEGEFVIPAAALRARQ